MTWGSFFVMWFACSVLFGIVAGRFLSFTDEPTKPQEEGEP